MLTRISFLNFFKSTPLEKRDKIIFIATFFLSFCFHAIIYLLYLTKTALFSKYFWFADQYLNGTIDAERIVDFSPFYSYLNISLQKIFGNPTWILMWLQFIAIAFSCALFFKLLRMSFNTVISLTGTIIFLLNRSIILYANVNEPEIFLILFLLCFVILAQKETIAGAVLAGVFLGLSLLIRLNFLPLALITPIIWILIAKKTGCVRNSVLFLIPVIVVIIGLMVRNYTVIGSFNPVVMNPGDVFFEGNNPNANGQNAVYPPMIDNCIDEFQSQPDPAHSLYRLVARRCTNNKLGIAEVNSFWSQKAANFIIDNPFVWIKALSKKLLYFFHNSRWHDIATVVTDDLRLQKVLLPTIPFGIVSALCIVGILLSLHAWRNRLLLLTLFVCQLAVMLLTYSSDRQRVSVVFVMIFFACVTLDFLLRRSNSVVLRLTVFFCCIVLLPFFFIKNDCIKDSLYVRKQFDTAQSLLSEAFAARQNGDLRTASKMNVNAYVHVPYLIESRLSGLCFKPDNFGQQTVAFAKFILGNSTDESSKLDLITILLENGKFDEAVPLITELEKNKSCFSRNTSQSSQPLFYSARVNEMNNDKAEAVIDLKKALKNNPGDPWVLSHLAVLTDESKYKNFLIRYFDEIDAEYFIGLAGLDNEDFNRAAESFTYVVKKMPEYRDGYIYLAIACGGLKKFEEAANYYSIAMRIKQEPLFKEKEIIAIFKGFATKEPDNMQANYFYAMTLGDFGYYEDAINVLRDRFPNDSLYAPKIAQLENLANTYK